MVYIDNYNAPFRGMTMCHMMAETVEELDAFAKSIGLNPAWRQGGSWPHYDVAMSKKKQAIAAGAKEVTCRELVALVQGWRKNQTGRV